MTKVEIERDAAYQVVQSRYSFIPLGGFQKGNTDWFAFTDENAVMHSKFCQCSKPNCVINTGIRQMGEMLINRGYKVVTCDQIPILNQT